MLAATLLDYYAFPGRYATVMREPRILFDGATQVLSLAAGRIPEDWPEGVEIDEHLRQAARFFVRAVMLRPTADHYTLMGVSPGFDATTLRDHYRMLMRMTHPDFAAEGDAWPSDAATRINLANDVLGSVVRRAEYDQGLPAHVQVAPVAMPRGAPVAPARAVSGAAEQTQRRFWPVAALAVGLLAVLVVWQWPSDTSGDSLIRIAQEQAVASAQPRIAGDGGNTPKKTERAPGEALASIDEGVARPTGRQDRIPTPLPLPPATPEGSTSSKPAPSLAANTPPMDRTQVAQRENRAVPETVKPGVSGPVAGPSSLPTGAQARSQTPVASMPPPSTASAFVQGPSRAPVPAEQSGSQATSMALVAAPPTVRQEPGVVVIAATKPENLRMADVQPMLGQLLGALASGRGEQISRLVDRSARQGDGGARFVDMYNRTVFGARGVRVGAVQFADRGVGEQLAVDGVVLLHIVDDTARSQTRELVVRAWFSSRDGQPVLTQLTTGEPAR